MKKKHTVLHIFMQYLHIIYCTGGRGTTVYLYILYSVFFFIEPKVFVNLTYLYLSEIKKQGLIFSVGMGHLKIRKKDFRKSSSLVTNSVQRWHLKFGFLTIRLLGLSTSMVSWKAFLWSCGHSDYISIPPATDLCLQDVHLET